MTEQQFFTSVRDSLVAVLNVNESEVSAESNIISDLGAESIDLLDVSCELEKFVGYEVDFNDVMKFTKDRKKSEIKDLSVGDVIEYLKVKTN